MGAPGVPDRVSLRGLLIPIRRRFRQYVNLRPVRLLKGLTSSLSGRGADEIEQDHPHDAVLGRERFAAIQQEYPDVRADQYHIDILTAHFVRHPDWFDVVVGNNLFGDILSDLGSAVAGGIGVAPSANLNPERVYLSMFEPVHGSAPDIAWSLQGST